jgi:hypothetical protein
MSCKHSRLILMFIEKSSDRCFDVRDCGSVGSEDALLLGRVALAGLSWTFISIKGRDREMQSQVARERTPATMFVRSSRADLD